MPAYSFQCTICKFKDTEGKLFTSFDSFKKHKCPKCGAPVQQTFINMTFKIRGYCYENEAKGKSYYRDIGKEKRKTHSIV